MKQLTNRVTGILILFVLISTNIQAVKLPDINKITFGDSVQVQNAIDNLIEASLNNPEDVIPKLHLIKNKISSYPYSPTQKIRWNYQLNLGLMRASEKSNKIRDAILYGEESVKNSDKIGMYSQSQSLRVDLGYLYYSLDDKLIAMNLLYKSLSSWDGNLPKEKLPEAYIGIAQIHLDQKNFQDAEKSIREALKYNPKPAYKAEVYNVLGQINYRNDNYLAALEQFSQALVINEKIQSDESLGKNYKQIANVFYKLGRYEKAERFYFLAVEHDSACMNKEELANVYGQLMNLYTIVSKSDKAFEFGMLALDVQENNSDLSLKENVYKGLSDIHRAKGEFEKALEYHTEYNKIVKLKADLAQKEINSEFKVKYEIEKKERELEELNNQKRLTELAFQQRIEDNNKEKNMLFTFGVLMFIIIILGAVILFNYQRQIESNKTITLKTEEINRVKIKELEKSLRLESVNAMLKGQEIERRRIAKDLHDSVGALLSSIKLHFESMNKVFSSDKNKNLYSKTKQLIDDACHEVRNISHDMMPGSLEKFGLIPALQDYTSKLKLNKKLEVDVVDYGIPQHLDNTVSMNAYRIVQELLNNVIKHSDAREVMVQLTMKEGKLNIMVEDDGIGFNPERDKEKGIGLKNIISRVNYLNGEIHFDTQNGNGTNVMIDFPVAS